MEEEKKQKEEAIRLLELEKNKKCEPGKKKNKEKQCDWTKFSLKCRSKKAKG